VPTFAPTFRPDRATFYDSFEMGTFPDDPPYWSVSSTFVDPLFDMMTVESQGSGRKLEQESEELHRFDYNQLVHATQETKDGQGVGQFDYNDQLGSTPEGNVIVDVAFLLMPQ